PAGTRSAGSGPLFELRDELRARYRHGRAVAAGGPPPAYELVVGDVMNQGIEVLAAVLPRIFDRRAQIGGRKVDEHHLLLGRRQAPGRRAGRRVWAEAGRRVGGIVASRTREAWTAHSDLPAHDAHLVRQAGIELERRIAGDVAVLTSR